MSYPPRILWWHSIVWWQETGYRPSLIQTNPPDLSPAICSFSLPMRNPWFMLNFEVFLPDPLVFLTLMTMLTGSPMSRMHFVSFFHFSSGRVLFIPRCHPVKTCRLVPCANTICWWGRWEREELKMTSRFWPQQLEWDCHSLRWVRMRFYGLRSWSGLGHMYAVWMNSRCPHEVIDEAFGYRRLEFRGEAQTRGRHQHIHGIKGMRLSESIKGMNEGPKTEAVICLCICILIKWWDPWDPGLCFSHPFLLSTLWNTVCISFA